MIAHAQNAGKTALAYCLRKQLLKYRTADHSRPAAFQCQTKSICSHLGTDDFQTLREMHAKAASGAA
jgi:hypothetical protein